MSGEKTPQELWQSIDRNHIASKFSYKNDEGRSKRIHCLYLVNLDEGFDDLKSISLDLGLKRDSERRDTEPDFLPILNLNNGEKEYYFSNLNCSHDTKANTKPFGVHSRHHVTGAAIVTLPYIEAVEYNWRHIHENEIDDAVLSEDESRETVRLLRGYNIKAKNELLSHILSHFLSKKHISKLNFIKFRFGIDYNKPMRDNMYAFTVVLEVNVTASAEQIRELVDSVKAKIDSLSELWDWGQFLGLGIDWPSLGMFDVKGTHSDFGDGEAPGSMHFQYMQPCPPFCDPD